MNASVRLAPCTRSKQNQKRGTRVGLVLVHPNLERTEAESPFSMPVGVASAVEARILISLEAAAARELFFLLCLFHGSDQSQLCEVISILLVERRYLSALSNIKSLPF